MVILKFIKLRWQQFFRSKYWQKSLVLNILMVFFALYLILVFLMLGLGLYQIIEETHCGQDVLKVVNGFVFYWILADLFIRFFLQKLPTMTVKPLLALPIKKSSIVHYVLGKSVMSFFNFLPLFIVLPFGFNLMANGYAHVQIWIWILAMVLVTLTVNFLNFLIESKTSKSEFGFIWLMIGISALFTLSYFKVVSFDKLTGQFFNAITTQLWPIAILFIIVLVLYGLNYRSLKQSLYLDETLHIKSKQAMTSTMSWTKNLGDIAPFIRMDLKMLMRNKRPRSSLWILLLGLLYGLFFYTNPKFLEQDAWLIFVGVFMTGIFVINYGQFIPAWDSTYYKFLMTQNLSYKTYLKSKFILMSGSVLLLFVLSIPYVYYGWKILLINFAAAVFNAGVSVYILLYAGSFNRKKIDLDRPAAFNYQGTGAVQWLIGIPLFLLPILIFYGFYKLIAFEVGIAALIIFGIVGIVFHQSILGWILKQYQSSKYKMIAAFSEEE